MRFFQPLAALDNMLRYIAWLFRYAVRALDRYRVDVPDIRQLTWTQARSATACRR